MSALTTRERLGLLTDLYAMAKNGSLPTAKVLSAIPAFLQDSDSHVLTATLDVVAAIDPYLVPHDLQPNYQRFIRKLYGEKVREIGWRNKAEEDIQMRVLRPALLTLVAIQGEDPQLNTEATRLAQAWLKDRTAVDFDVLGIVLRIAARHGNRVLFDDFRRTAKETEDLQERGLLIGALADFLDPNLHREALSLIFSDEFDPRESSYTLASDEPENWQSEYDFFKQNFSAILKRLPHDDAAYLPILSRKFCDEQHRVDVQAFWDPHAAEFAGAPRNLRRTLETISLCAALRDTQQSSVASFLRDY